MCEMFLQESGGNSVSVSSNTVLCNDGEFYFSLAEVGVLCHAMNP